MLKTQRTKKITVARNTPPRKKLTSPKVEKETPYAIKNLDYEQLTGMLHEPAAPTKTIVITVHGFLGSKENGVIKHTCIELSRAGIAAYRFDLSGGGDSEGRFEEGTPSKHLKDVLAVIEHFRKRYAKLILLGHSMGGTFTVITASRAKLDGIIVIAGLMRPEMLEHRNLATAQKEEFAKHGTVTYVKKISGVDVPLVVTAPFIEELRTISPLEAAKDIHCPVLILHGTADNVVPQSDSEELFARLYSKDIILVGGADHAFSFPSHMVALAYNIIDWLKKQKLA